MRPQFTRHVRVGYSLRQFLPEAKPFTGEKNNLKFLSDSAAAGGILCGVVTASHWAVSETIAEKVIGEFSSIQIWGPFNRFLSPETMFQLDRVRYAYCAAKKLLKKSFLSGSLTMIRYQVKMKT